MVVPRRRKIRIAVWLLVGFSALYLFTSRGNIGAEDAGLRLLMAQRLLDGKDMTWPAYRPRWNRPHVMHWWLGHVLVLSITELAARGLTAVVPRLPKELVSEALACGLQALTAALIPVLVFLWLAAADFQVAAAATAAVAIAAASPIWLYSQDCYYEIHEGLFVLGAFFAGLLALRTGKVKYCVISGAAAGVAWMVRVTNLLYVFAAAAAWAIPWWLERRRADERSSRPPVSAALLCYFLGFLPFWVAESVFDFWRYGLWPVPMDHRAPPLNKPTLGDLPRYFLDAVFGPNHGVIWFMPTVVVGAFFAGRVVRRLGWYGAAVCAAVGLDFFVATIFTGVGPDINSLALRFFVRAVPLSAIMVGEWVIWAGERQVRWRRVFTVALLVTAVGVQGLMTTVHRLRWFFETKYGMHPPAPVIAQPGYAVHCFSNYWAERRFVPSKQAAGSRDILKRGLQVNYPNYWWALGVNAGLPKIPLLASALSLLALSVFAFYKFAAETRRAAAAMAAG